jgi:DNA mismatch endonuclease Vsr
LDKLTPEQRRKNMQAVRSKGSKIELMLGKELWKRGYRYRKNDKTVFGKPDFVFKKYKTVIFCDSEFWHGKDWSKKKSDIKSNIAFWQKKIEGNIKRDILVNKRLTKEGWKIVRFWGKEIEKNMLICVEKFEKTIK